MAENVNENDAEKAMKPAEIKAPITTERTNPHQASNNSVNDEAMQILSYYRERLTRSESREDDYIQMI